MAARGEVWSCAFPDIGRRPLVVLSRNAAIPRLRRTLVAPCTTTIRGLPSEVILDPSEDQFRANLLSTSMQWKVWRSLFW